MKTIIKYLGIYKEIFKVSLISDLEFRANFFTRFLTDFFWYFSQVVTYEVLFLHANKLGNFGIFEVRVFLGILFITDACFMILFHENLDNLSDKIRKGELDILLTRPINSQFFVSLQKANTAIFGNLILGITWLIYSLYQLPVLHANNLIFALIMIPNSVLIVYSVRFIFCTFSLIVTKAESLQFLWWQVYKLGMRPDSSYPKILQWILLTIIPVGLIASIPTKFLFMDQIKLYFFLPFLVTGIFLYLSQLFWNFCLKYYSSASS